MEHGWSGTHGADSLLRPLCREDRFVLVCRASFIRPEPKREKAAIQSASVSRASLRRGEAD